MLRLSIQLHNALAPVRDSSSRSIGRRENARRQSREDTRCFAHRLGINDGRIYGEER